MNFDVLGGKKLPKTTGSKNPPTEAGGFLLDGGLMTQLSLSILSGTLTSVSQNLPLSIPTDFFTYVR